MIHITEPLPSDKHARLVFGLDWRAYPMKGGDAERRRYADAFGATHYVEYKLGSERIGGFAMQDRTDLKHARLYSGAARIALHDRVKSRPAALVLLQDGQRVHAVYVVRGAVRSDEVLSLEDAQRRRLAIEQACLRGNLELITLGSGAQLGDVDEPFQASELLAARKIGRIAKLPISIPAVIPLIVLVGAGVFGATKLIDVLSPPPPPPRPPTFQERYAEAVHSAFARPMPRASALAPALLDAVGRTESVRKGWQVQVTDCPAMGHCTITYGRQGGSFADFLTDAPSSMQPIVLARDGKALTTQGPAVPSVAPVAVKEAKQWPSEQALIDRLQTPAQRMSSALVEIRAYGYTVQIDEPKPLLSLAGVEASEAGPHLIKQGTWIIEGFRWQAPLLAKLPPNMALESLKVELKLQGGSGSASRNDLGDTPYGVHFTAKGKFYVLD
ncbi:hypothetical protein ACV229_16505 [Burkholderia sp. MR1-5-21]